MVHLESDGEIDANALSDEQVDKLIEIAAKVKPKAAFPWEELSEHLSDLRVAEQMGKGATTEDARTLPLLTYYELLMLRGAIIESEPARTEKAQADFERKEREKEDAKKRS